MDARNQNRERAREWISDRRNKSILIAIAVLVTIVLLQARNLRPQRLMCPLFADCQLRNLDIQRMQIALSRSGLKDFQVHGGKLFVPQQQHGQYLQAISDQNAIPTELQESTAATPSANPFLTHSQQAALQRESRNKKLQELMMLLPFVEQAWFEMDESQIRGSLHQPEKSAVVTIRPKSHQPLLEQHLYTVRQLVCGAISGINPERIVIVDLTTGFAHQGNFPQADWEQKLAAQRVAYSRQQQLESRLRETLQRYEGLKINVLVEPASGESSDQDNRTAFAPTLPVPIPVPVQGVPDIANPQPAPIMQAALAAVDDNDLDQPLYLGANGQVSIADFFPVQPATHETNASFAESLATIAKTDEPERINANVQPTAYESLEPQPRSGLLEKVTVIVEVPQQLLTDRFGRSNSSGPTFRIEGSHRDQGRVIESWMEKLKPELEQKIRPVLSMQGLANASVIYNVLPDSTVPATGWFGSLIAIGADNWPSLAVLIGGLMLISLIAERGKPLPRQSGDGLASAANSSQIRLADHPIDSSEERNCETAKAQLSQMIEKDPDAAARVIENWIRDAA